MEPHRLRAPKRDGAILAEPSLSECTPLVAKNRSRLARWDYDCQGRRIDRLRELARREIYDRSRHFLAGFGHDLPEGFADDPSVPLIVTGHQADLFHPGVWIKNFAIAETARNVGGVALNLIVDNDLPKASAIRVPRDVEGVLRGEYVDFDEGSNEVPFEDWKVRDEQMFASFPNRVRATLGGLIADPLIDKLWPEALKAARVTDRLGLRFASARRAVEQSWGVKNLEIPLGSVCETDSFRWFASHLLAHLPRFRAEHNAALARYRATYRIRSKNHPVPALDREGDWLESPFWVWRADAPRRRPLMARQKGEALEVRIAGETETLASIRLSPNREACCAVEDLRELSAKGIRIRTRALTTTMFARLVLGDLFFHGIGGAKYDELGDEVIRGFFGFEPPPYATISLTAWIGVEADPTVPARVVATKRGLRDLEYNPDRILSDTSDSEVQALIEAKNRAISRETTNRRERVARYYEIRRLNEAMAGVVAGLRERQVAEARALESQTARNTIAMGREWSIAVHSESRLRAMLAEGISAPVRVPKFPVSVANLAGENIVGNGI